MVNSPIKAEDLATEFSVVRNEFEMGENSPGSVLSQRMMAVAYEWHNYGKSTIGNRSDIERVPVDNLRAFYKKFYQPDNAVLVVAGQFDEKKALEYITKYFGSLPRPDRKLSGDLHRGAGPGRRAIRHPAAGRQRRAGRPASTTSPPARTPSSRRSRSWPRSSIPSPRAGSTRPWSRRRRRPACPPWPMRPRSGRPGDHRRGQHQGAGRVGEGPRHDPLDRGGRGTIGRHPGGGRSGPPVVSSRTSSSRPPIPTASPSSSASGPRRATGGSTSSTATGSRR